MQLKISDAARAYGVARSTIYRNLRAGRISATRQGDGSQVIDLGELIRYWGEPPNPPHDATPRNNGTSEGEQGEVLRELHALRRELQELREDMRALPAPPSIWTALRRRLAAWLDPER